MASDGSVGSFSEREPDDDDGGRRHLSELGKFGLFSQGNIYTLCSLPGAEPKRGDAVFAGELRGKVHCVDGSWNSSRGGGVGAARELSVQQEVVSMDVFHQGGSSSTVVLSVAIVRIDDDEEGQPFLNFYECGGGGDLSHFEPKASLRLSYFPYHLAHCSSAWSPLKACCHRVHCVLAGSDGKVHVFSSSRKQQDHHRGLTFQEDDLCGHFPEFRGGGSEQPAAVARKVDFAENVDGHRWTALATEGGRLLVWQVALATCSVVKRLSHELDGVGGFSDVRFFGLPNNLNLVAVAALEESLVFRDVEGNGLRRRTALRNSNGFDVVTSCAAMVVDEEEASTTVLLLGTYGQKVVAYEMNAATDEEETLAMSWTQSFSSPIFAMRRLKGEDADTIAVLTRTHLHVMKADIRLV